MHTCSHETLDITKGLLENDSSVLVVYVYLKLLHINTWMCVFIHENSYKYMNIQLHAHR